MPDDSLPIRTEMMSARQRCTILIASVLVAHTHWTPAPALVMVLCTMLATVASFGMKHAVEGWALFKASPESMLLEGAYEEPGSRQDRRRRTRYRAL
jgi:hypothetical protein